MKSFIRVLIVSISLTTIIFAQGLPVASPENVGLSSDRLKRLESVMLQYVEKKQIAGAVALIARKGKVAYLQSVGLQEVEAKTPMQNNTIFRIASMTKPITSVAVMILYEEGRLLLNDPVSIYIPEFKDMMVLNPERSTNGQVQSDSLVPAMTRIFTFLKTKSLVLPQPINILRKRDCRSCPRQFQKETWNFHRPIPIAGRKNFTPAVQDCAPPFRITRALRKCC